MQIPHGVGNKYRYPVLGEDVGQRARELLREIARANEMTIYAGAINRDYVHMLLSIPPQLSVSRAVQHLEGQEREYPHGAGLRGTSAQFRGAAFLGAGIFRLDRWARRTGDPGICSPPEEIEDARLEQLNLWRGCCASPLLYQSALTVSHSISNYPPPFWRADQGDVG